MLGLLRIISLFFALLCVNIHTIDAQDIRNTERSVKKVGRVEIRADRLYNDFSYISARDVYMKVVRLDSSNDRAKLRVAECYLKLNKPDKAEEWYNRLSKEFIGQSSQDLIKFGESLLKNKKYVPAKQIYEAVTQISPNDVRASNLLKGILDIDRFFIDSLNFQIQEVEFNSPEADFSPAFYKNGLVFASSRGTGSPIRYIYNWDHTNFLNLYYVSKTGGGRFSEPESFSTKVNTRYHEGPLAFFDKDRQVIFTRNNFYKGASLLSEEGVNRLQLFHSKWDPKKEKWINPKPLNIVSKEYSIGHPTVAENGKKMFFASNVSGGKGGVDIYYSEFKGGRWGKPVNLGKEINTNGNEMFPFMASDSVLYFASDGQQGLGGLDIFKAVFAADGSINVKNMGYPLNTNLDDFGLILSGDRGYFSSNRLGDDNIYEIFFNYAPVYIVLIDAETGEELKGITTVNNTSIGKPVNLIEVDGKNMFDAARNQQYSISGEAKGYQPKSMIFVNRDLPYNTVPHRVEVPMEKVIIKPPVAPEKGVFLIVTLRNESTLDPIPGKIIVAPEFSEKGFLVDTLTGEYRLKIPRNGVYLIEGKSLGYFSATDSISIVANSETQVFKKDILLRQALVGAKIRLNRVFFDFDKATLRPISKEELDKIVVFMKENPSLKVEIGGHTDNRGSATYNKALSGRRAASVMNYLIEHGIPTRRMTYAGYGFEQPEVPNDTDENRQLNRRVEFKITGIDYEYSF